MRPGELANMTLERTNFDMGFILRDGDTKTGEGRIVPINNRVINKVKQRYKYAVEHKHSLLFTNQAGGKLRQQDWNEHLGLRLRELNMPKFEGFSVKSFRNSYITEMLPKIPLFDLMRLVGHTNPKTTMGYYAYCVDALKKYANQHTLITSSLPCQQIASDLINDIQKRLKDDQRFDVKYEISNKTMKITLRY